MPYTVESTNTFTTHINSTALEIVDSFLDEYNDGQITLAEMETFCERTVENIIYAECGCAVCRAAADEWNNPLNQ